MNSNEYRRGFDDGVVHGLNEAARMLADKYEQCINDKVRRLAEELRKREAETSAR